MTQPDTSLLALAERVVDFAREKGANELAVSLQKGRFVELERRDGKLDKIREASSSGLQLELYVDQRYSSHSTSDLRWEALSSFIERGIAMTRLLAVDPHRGLADPSLYENRQERELLIEDPAISALEPEQRKDLAARLEEGARQVQGPIISIESGYYDSFGESIRVHSNGFVGANRSTSFWMGASVALDDPSGRKPSDGLWVGSRFFNDLEDPVQLGRACTERALGRLNQEKLDSGEYTVIFENRVSGQFLRHFMRALSGSALQQQRSFLADKVGQSVTAPLLNLYDNPFVEKGFGSRLYDADGISAAPRTLIEEGRLVDFLIDVYYARKLGRAPTGGSTSNLECKLGERDLDSIVASTPKGILVRGMLGGNSDTTRGDFSHGIHGFEIVDGKLGRSIGEMNISGNHSTFWQQLVELGNDPYVYSSYRIPSLVFEKVNVSGN
ncbi:MAG: TldD/PmbA family protein [Myxococcota bacterium]|jgi:PmbA protein|nr:TldD/PmbA family protein [Myxococcota bacterium]